MMKNNTPNRPESHWELLVLRQQMLELQREKRHLSSKSYERPLSPWENERLEKLLDEIMALIPQIGKIGFFDTRSEA